MSLVRYNNEVKNWIPVSFAEVLDDVFFRTPAGISKQHVKTPATDILEDETGYELHLALPGYNKEDLSIETEAGKLSVKGIYNKKEKRKELKYHSTEIVYGSFERNFKLPSNADEKNIAAEYVAGILKIRLPKQNDNKLKNTINIA